MPTIPTFTILVKKRHRILLILQPNPSPSPHVWLIRSLIHIFPECLLQALAHGRGLDQGGPWLSWSVTLAKEATERTGKAYGTVTGRAWLVHRGRQRGSLWRKTIRTSRQSWGDLRRSPPGSARDQREWSVAATQGARAEDEIQGQAEAPGHGLMALRAKLASLDRISLARRPQ